jgi:hypothetical protein
MKNVTFQNEGESSLSAKEQAHYQKHYGQLIGGTISQIFIVNSGEDYISPAPVLIVKVGTKTFQVELLSDEEGNDSGHADIINITGV